MDKFPIGISACLLAHDVRLHDEPYLRTRFYLHPHPLELMLRNHG